MYLKRNAAFSQDLFGLSSGVSGFGMMLPMNVPSKFPYFRFWCSTHACLFCKALCGDI